MKSLEIELDNIESSIDLFAMVMKMRMKSKAKEGWIGWDDKKFEKILMGKLKKNIGQLDHDKHISAIDAANFLMMIWIMNLPEINL